MRSCVNELTGPCRVLVADANRIRRSAACQAFRDLGADVDEAADGLEAALTAFNEGFDVVILGADLPKYDPYQIAAVVRSPPSRSRDALLVRQRTGATLPATPGFDRTVRLPIAAADALELVTLSQSRREPAAAYGVLTAGAPALHPSPLP